MQAGGWRGAGGRGPGSRATVEGGVGRGWGADMSAFRSADQGLPAQKMRYRGLRAAVRLSGVKEAVSNAKTCPSLAPHYFSLPSIPPSIPSSLHPSLHP
eukprot:750724-Hanusia_phi.AAC.2